MTALTAGADLDRFEGLIGDVLGLGFDEARRPALTALLGRRLAATRLEAGVYLSRLTRGNQAEVQTLARELTVPESCFFRNADQFRALAEAVLPSCIAARAPERRLRLLSLGCASGDEAYSLAILLRVAPLTPDWTVEVIGVDVNQAVIDKARQARYSEWSLRETPDEQRRRWFVRRGADYLLDEDIRSLVHFEAQNLVDDDPELWRPASCDVILCRNVIMYFTPEQARRLVARGAAALRQGGYLFLGHAETLRNVSDDFHLCHSHGTFYYERKHADPRRPRSLSVAAGRAAALEVAATEGSWVDSIRLASARVERLALQGRDASGEASGRRLPSTAVAADGLRVMDLAQQERFGDALALLAGEPGTPDRAEVELLRAVLLLHEGQLASAEAACRLLLLDAGELDAGVHYVMALCREGAGDLAGAAQHDQTAAYLDQEFAMPRLHLGLMARRTGRHAEAIRELRQALILLEREIPSRLLMFGGGFGREVLLSLCRAELRGLGE
jgi:chemotaxis protein methyltransferase CheR